MQRLRINWIMKGINLSGGHKSNRLIAEAMVRRGHDVTIAYSTASRPWPSPLRPRAFARRVRAEWLERRPRRHHLESSTARLIPIDAAAIRPDHVPDADVTIGTFWETMEWIRDWPESKGLKAYFIRHYETIAGDPARVDATYRLPCLKLVIATWLGRLMAEKFDDDGAVLVPNGVDWTQFDSAPRGKRPTPAVGMLYSRAGWKGADTAFEAIRIAQRHVPALRVVAFGSERLDRTRGLPAHFEYHRRPSQRLIPDLYRGTDCWIVPSTSEGFGMPGLEASACRCPVVSTRCGGPEDYVRHGVSGYLVEVGAAEEMARRILQVIQLDDPAWRSMSEASYAIARTFDWDRSAGILEGALLAGVRRPRREAAGAIAR